MRAPQVRKIYPALPKWRIMWAVWLERLRYYANFVLHHILYHCIELTVLISIPQGQWLVHLIVQWGDFLLIGCRKQEATHLALQGVLHLYVDVVACRFLLVIGIHTVKTGIANLGSSANVINSGGSVWFGQLARCACDREVAGSNLTVGRVI